MRYFWHALIAIIFVALVVFLFFVFSLSNKHRITFTDDLPELTEPTVTVADPVSGAADAAVTIVEFGDYQCGACGTVHDVLSGVLAAYPDDVRVVWKDMPNTSAHNEALNAAIAARCAGKQGDFFAYHAYLFANQLQLGSTLYSDVAQELGLRERAFQSCYDNQDTLPLVQKSYEEGLALDIAATPTIFINGERFTGSLTASEITATVESILHGL